MAGALPSGSDPSGYDLGHFGTTGAQLSQLAGRTLGNVQDYYRGQVQGSSGWGSASDILFEGLSTALAFPAALVQKLVHMIMGFLPTGSQVSAFVTQLGDFVGDRWNDLTGVISDFVDFVTGLVGHFDLGAAVDFITNIFNTLGQIADAIAGAVVNPINSIVSGFVGWIQGLLGFQKTTKGSIVALQNNAISLTTIASRNPAWVCRYSIADVTYPEFLNTARRVFGWTGPADDWAGTVDTGTYDHDHDMSYYDATAEFPQWGTPQGYSRGGYVAISNATVMDTVAIVASKDAGSIDNIYLEVFRELPDLSLAQLYSIDISASLGTTVAYIEKPLPSSLIVQEGERYLVRCRNASTTATNLWVVGAATLPHSPQSGFKTTTATDSNRTAYTTAQANAAIAATESIPWAMLAAKNFVATDQSYPDDFNRSALGGLYVPISSSASQLQIVNGAVRYSGASNGWQAAAFIRQTSGDQQMVEADLFSIGNSGAGLGLLIGGNKDFSNVLYLKVGTNFMRLYQGALGSFTPVTSSIPVLANDAHWGIWYDAPNNTYRVLKNGSQVLTWTDSTNLMQHGAGHRYGGLIIERASGLVGGAMDNWRLSDYTPQVINSQAAPVAVATLVTPTPTVKTKYTMSPGAVGMSTSAVSPTIASSIRTEATAKLAPGTLVTPTPVVHWVQSVTYTFSTPGTMPFTIPDWADFLDIVTVGAGSGSNATAWGGGGSGHRGAWAGSTYSVGGLAIPDRSIDLDVTVGAGGAGGQAPGGLGHVGGDCVISRALVPLVTGTGGGGPVGAAGNFTFNGFTYVGGATTGQAPGSGGVAQGVYFANGNPGAAGAVWIRAYRV